MTLVQKVNTTIIVCIVITCIAICVTHWVNERRAAHLALEEEGRRLAGVVAEQVARLTGPADPQQVQSLLNLASRWCPEIIEITYYAFQTEGQSSGPLRFVASTSSLATVREPPPLAYECLRRKEALRKRRYHDDHPHVAIYAPVVAQGRPLGALYLRVSPDQIMEGVRADEQRLVNTWLLVGFFSAAILIIAVRLLITGRVEALAQAAQSGAGEEIERIGRVHPLDEIGQLALLMGRMLRSVLSRNLVWERLYNSAVVDQSELAAEDRAAEIEEEAALALRDRLERELQIANRIQLSLLPEKFPADHGLSFAVRYSPAGEVGGDIYDFVVLDADTLGIMIADVAGRGIPAAFVAGMTKIAFSQFALHNQSPSQVVSAINDYLHSHLRTGHYVTIFYGIFNRGTKKFRYVRAGHQPPFVIRHDSNALEMLQTGGPMVGAAEKMIFEESEIDLRPGDKIVMLTDGLAECKSEEGKRLGQNGIRDMLQDVGAKSAQAVAAHIFQNAVAFRGSIPPEDDITILVAEVTDGTSATPDPRK
jgi:sigma-B regulation protein RsbU (phosphoserine phosphatase)